MSPELAIIFVSSLLPAGAVGMILHKAGKTQGYALFGAGIVLAVTIGLTIILLKVSALWPNMPFQAFVLLLPLIVAGFFLWLMRGRGPNRRS